MISALVAHACGPRGRVGPGLGEQTTYDLQLEKMKSCSKESQTTQIKVSFNFIPSKSWPKQHVLTWDVLCFRFEAPICGMQSWAQDAFAAAGINHD